MAISIPITTTYDSKGIDKASRDISKAEGGWAKAGAGIKAAALPAAAAIGVIGVAAYKATKDASALGETFNAVDKVFGDAGGTITAFGEIAATEAGLSQRAFQQMATTTGAALTNMGYSNDDAADSTVELTKRAADMASVFDTDVETALAAINSGLKGEAEPLKAFGVGLSAAEVQAYALAEGMWDGEDAIDKHAKALATEALILDQTSKLQGDFADTSDSAANAQRIMAADVENLSASFGQALLPALEKLIAIGTAVVGWVADNQTAFQIMIAAVAAVAAAILVINAVMKVWAAISAVVSAANLILGTSFTVALGPIALIIAAILAVIAVGILIYKNWDKISAFLKKVWKGIQKAAVAVFRAIGNAIKAYFNLYKKIITTVWNAIKKVVTTVLRGLKSAISAYLRAYKAVFTTVFRAIKAVVTTYINAVKAVVKSVMNAIKAAVRTAMNVVKAIFRGDWRAVLSIVRSAISSLISLVRSIPGKIKSAIGNLGSLLYNAGRQLIQGLINGIKSLLGSLGGIAGSILDKVNPFSRAMATPSPVSLLGAPRARGASTRNQTTNLTMNISARDPYVAARVMKRASEGYDLSQGRGRGVPLAMAW